MMNIEIPTINRGCLVVYAQQPLVDWFNSLPGVEIKDQMELADTQKDETVYLIPDFFDNEELNAIIANVFEKIFRSELGSWWTNEDDWPEITWKLFNEWFTYKSCSMVLDMGTAPLEQEE